jgi:hypothetical protein
MSPGCETRMANGLKWINEGVVPERTQPVPGEVPAGSGALKRKVTAGR